MLVDHFQARGSLLDGAFAGVIECQILPKGGGRQGSPNSRSMEGPFALYDGLDGCNLSTAM